jgi:hypothetical protein
MTEEQAKMAREFVACPRWRWVPGMAALGRASVGKADPLAVWRVEDVYCRLPLMLESVRMRKLEVCTRKSAIYDAVPWLPDPATGLLLIHVVRAAHEDQDISVVKMPAAWVVVRGMESDGPVIVTDWRGPTSEAALLAALQAAPPKTSSVPGVGLAEVVA